MHLATASGIVGKKIKEEGEKNQSPFNFIHPWDRLIGNGLLVKFRDWGVRTREKELNFKLFVSTVKNNSQLESGSVSILSMFLYAATLVVSPWFGVLF